jgi:hypothetical protein
MAVFSNKKKKSREQVKRGLEVATQINHTVRVINNPDAYDYKYYDEDDHEKVCGMLREGLTSGCLTRAEFDHLDALLTDTYNARNAKEKAEASARTASLDLAETMVTADLPVRLAGVPNEKDALVREITAFLKEKETAITDLEELFWGLEIDQDEYNRRTEKLAYYLNEYPISRDAAITLMEADWTSVGRHNLLETLDELEKECGEIAFEIDTSVGSEDPDIWEILVFPASEADRRLRMRKRYESPWSRIEFNRDTMKTTDNGAMGNEWDLS